MSAARAIITRGMKRKKNRKYDYLGHLAIFSVIRAHGRLVYTTVAPVKYWVIISLFRFFRGLFLIGTI
jgi:hypothetical protein